MQGGRRPQGEHRWQAEGHGQCGVRAQGCARYHQRPFQFAPRLHPLAPACSLGHARGERGADAAVQVCFQRVVPCQQPL